MHSRDLTRQQREHYDHQQKAGVVIAKDTPDFSEIKANFTVAQDKHVAELDEATGQVVEWYKMLIAASSCIFEVENRTRRESTRPRSVSA